MATSTAIWRGLQGCVVLLISALLLLLTLDFGSEVSQTALTDRRADLEVVPTKQGSTSVPKSIALPFGRQHHADNFSSPLDHHSLFERADPPSNYAALVCKGGIFLESIKAAFEGTTPGISFPESELENGWTKTTEVEEDDLEAIERRWKGTFDALFGAYPPQSDIKPIILVQNKEYDTILDDHVDRPTQAQSQGLYYPSQQLAMSVVSYSAAQRLLDRNRKEKPLSKSERDALLPTISRLSDLIWLAWTTVASNPERLRYLARDNISNENTKAVIRYLLLRDKGQANSVVWPGVDYDGNSDEGKALLATPNGRATAWLLIDHGHQMDWRMKSRQLRVYIFSYAGEYCMLWDLEPQSPHTRSKREEHIKQHTKPQPKYSTEPHVKRAGKEDFDAAKKQGDIAYNEMQAAFDGVCAREVRDFDPSAFENGWTRKQDSKSLPDQVWQDVIKKVAGEGKAPTTETSFYVNLVHDKDFTNSQGQPVKYIKADVGNALYEQHYIPASSAIIVSQTRSPAYTVKKRLGKDAPSNQEINDKYVPPLNRWSDATWTLWKEKGGGNDLRYIGRDYIFNQQTESVMNYIFDQHGSEDHKFPGLDFGMDSDEGRALLGTPNGIGAARLLIDRASELGRRDVRIYIFEPEEEYPCMLVDMRPAQVQSRALDERNGNSTKSPGLAKRQKKSKRYNKNSGSALRAFARRDKARLHARAHNKRHDETSQTRHSTLIDKQQDQPKHRALINPHTESLAQSHPSGSRPVKRRYTGELESPHPAPIQHHDDNDDDWFQSHSAHHTSPLTRRDAASDYEKALCTGRSMWAKVMQAFDNPGSDAKPTLPITALDNGWSKTDNPKEVDPEWTQYFDLKLGKGKIPNAELVRHIMLDQNKDFQNSQGGDVNDYSGTDEAGTALYYTTYIPTISSIIVKNTVSPLHVISEIFTNMGVAPPSTLEIAQSYVPPLARWSDVTWTVYASLCASQAPPSDPSKLRYIGRDSLINREAQVIIAYILQRHRGTVVVPFPGLEFGMDEEEGLALLGTPNGMGVGWLVRDRVAELGRRAPRVRVWTVGARAMMGWDLVPVRARPVVVPGG